MRAARGLLGIDQRRLAELSGLSLPTIQRMEASDGIVRGNVNSLMKLIGALEQAGIELISDNATSLLAAEACASPPPPHGATAPGGGDSHDRAVLTCIARVLVLSVIGVATARPAWPSPRLHLLAPDPLVLLFAGAVVSGFSTDAKPYRSACPLPAAMSASTRSPASSWSSSAWAARRQSVRARLRPPRKTAAARPAFYPVPGRPRACRHRRRCLYLLVCLGADVARLLGARPRAPPGQGNTRAGRIYLLMASFSGLAFCWPSACWPAAPATTRSTPCVPRTLPHGSPRWW